MPIARASTQPERSRVMFANAEFDFSGDDFGDGSEQTRLTEAYPVMERGQTFAKMRLAHGRGAAMPAMLSSGKFTLAEGKPTTALANHDEIKKKFPTLYGGKDVKLVPAAAAVKHAPLKVGCVLSGGQAAGGHNCICGLFDYLAEFAPGSTLYGFLGGPKGVMTNSARVLDASTIDEYRNTGGFTMLASGRDKIEKPEEFKMAADTARARGLDGLVVIGGDDSNTNAAVLAEHFKGEGLKTRVIGLPKTIDGDLKNEHCETSFGFDTAAKLFAELVGNIMVDCESSAKYYHFIRLMGREASHLTLEVALRTQPTICFIGEEVKAKGQTLAALTALIADTVADRAAKGMEYGVILIPEGLVDFVPEMGALIREINEVLARREAMDDSNSYEGNTADTISDELTIASATVYDYLPDAIKQQLLLDRDPHGNVQVAKIESERLLGALVEAELAKRREAGQFTAKFNSQFHYFGYEGRCPPPSNFDANYCSALGRTAGALIGGGCTGMMASLKGLTKPPEEWEPRGAPLTGMLCLERRKGKDKPVIRKALVELDGAPFAALKAARDGWRLAPSFEQPGPIQFEGPTAECVSLTLQHEQLGSADVPSLKAERSGYTPRLPAAFAGAGIKLVRGEVPAARADNEFVSELMPKTYGAPRLEVRPTGEGEGGLAVPSSLTVGVVFCGRQCPGAHNVLAGLRHFLAARAGTGAKLLGFVNGTRGLFTGEARELGDKDVAAFLNQGGMQLLGRSADVIRTTQHFEKAEASCEKLKLDALVLIGGAVSNSDTAALAEHFAAGEVATRVIGVPASIDGDLLVHSEGSIGFDTACRVYASIVGNLATDAASARKYWYFVRIMGRSPSHITLACANLTQPNVALIGEELEAKRMSLSAIVSSLADTVEARAANGKHFGVVLIPEGLIEYIPEVNALLREISYARRNAKSSSSSFGRKTPTSYADVLKIEALLSPWSKALLESMPAFIRKQLLLEEQASDHKAQLSQIETERLLAELVRLELGRRRAAAQMTATWNAPDPKFNSVCFYLGYQARSSLPSTFDCDLSYTLGNTAGALAAAGVTGYMATAHCLTSEPEKWRVCGTPLFSLLSAENRAGAAVAAIRPSQVNLSGAAFHVFEGKREEARMRDCYANPGPLQFKAGLKPIGGIDRLAVRGYGRGERLQEVEDIAAEIQQICWPGCSDSVLKTTLAQLRALKESLQVLQDSAERTQTSAIGDHTTVSQLTVEEIAQHPDN